MTGGEQGFVREEWIAIVELRNPLATMVVIRETASAT